MAVIFQANCVSHYFSLVKQNADYVIKKSWLRVKVFLEFIALQCLNPFLFYSLKKEIKTEQKKL